ncbi:MAG TPA: hypothetical protein QF646_08065 [Candidatus Poseidoniales archaeon]|nr:hypothetical protein [Candidatus Poseidoniales archaeon]
MRAGPILLIGVLIICSLSIVTATQSSDVPEQQRLKYGQSKLFLYGTYEGNTQGQYSFWSHAATSDTESESSVSEQFIPGQSHGGKKNFIFEARHANNETVLFDTTRPIVGFVNLNNVCNTCQKDVTVQINAPGYSDTAIIPLPENDTQYRFEFTTHRIEDLAPGEGIEITVEFTAGTGPLDSFTFYLGPGQSEISFPIRPPIVREIPNLDPSPGQDYVSPYADPTSGFVIVEANPPTILSPILFFLFTLALGIAGLIAAPPFTLRTTGVILICLALLSSLVVIPITSGLIMVNLAVDEKDQHVWTIEELLGLTPADGKLFGYTAGEEFSVFINYDEIYRRQTGGTVYHALGFEEEAKLFGNEVDGGAPYKIREQIQLYFSLLEVDLQPGAAALVHVKVVNNTALQPVPQWAAGNAGSKNESLGSGFGYRWVVPEGDIEEPTVEVFGKDFEWDWMPLLLVPLALGLSGFGLYRWIRAGGWTAWRLGIPIEYLDAGVSTSLGMSDHLEEFDELYD